MKLFISLFLIMISIFMLFLNHPLTMGFLILIQTLLICMLSGFLMNTYWFSYILFLTFLGGLLILFIYVSSIASNELFFSNIKNKILFMLFSFFIFYFSLIFYNNLNINNFMFNLEMKNFFDYATFINNENNINLSKLYNNQTFILMIMLIIYLFITLIAIVKITNIFFGPLRSNSI